MLPPEVEKTYQLIRSQFGDVVFTGSRAMGVETESSDWDFVVSAERGEEVKLGFVPQGDESRSNQMYFTSVRIGEVNLIIDHRGEGILANWAAATDYCAERAVADKLERIKIFESFGA